MVRCYERDMSTMLVKTLAKCWTHVFRTQPASQTPSAGSLISAVYTSSRSSVDEIKVSIKGVELIQQKGLALTHAFFAFAMHKCSLRVYEVVICVEISFETLLDALAVSTMATFHLSLVV